MLVYTGNYRKRTCSIPVLVRHCGNRKAEAVVRRHKPQLNMIGFLSSSSKHVVCGLSDCVRGSQTVRVVPATRTSAVSSHFGTQFPDNPVIRGFPRARAIVGNLRLGRLST